MNFSPTLLNNFDKIANDTFCGLLFKAMYVDKAVISEPSDAMRLGQYFEFKATGALIRETPEMVNPGEMGKFFESSALKFVEPQPETTKKGDLTAEYKRVMQQVGFWPVFLEKFGITKTDISYEMNYEHLGMNIKGIADFVGTWNDDKPVIIDLKYTGQIDNKWDDFGWGHGDIGHNWHRMLQPVIYCYLYEKLHGVRPEFIFYVASSKDLQRKIFKVIVSDKAITKMLEQVVYTSEMINYHETTGWTATQNYLNCASCPLNKICEQALTTPNIIEVNI